jgi:hypothetical protein
MDFSNAFGPFVVFLVTVGLATFLFSRLWRLNTKRSAARAPIDVEAVLASAAGSGLLVRSYFGETPAEALRRFRSEATPLAQAGYFPTSQAWAQGQWQFVDFVLALILTLVLIGWLLLAAMLIMRPESVLIVTYQARVMPVPAPAA